MFAKSDRLSGEALYRGLKERGVLVRWWAGGGRIGDYLRITIGSDEQMAVLTDRIAQLLKQS